MTIVEELKSRQSKIGYLYVSVNQEVYTPNFLVARVLDHLPKKVWCNPDLKWCDVAVKSGEFMVEIIIRLMDGLKKKIPNEKKRYGHIVKNMVYGYAVTDVGAMVSRKTVYGDRNIKGNIIDKYFTEGNKMKFDLIVGNPPYNPPRENESGIGDSSVIWPDFVKKALDDLKDGGHLAIIHPCMWRKPDAKLYPLLSKYQIKWIEMHPSHSSFGREDGFTVFGVWTSFDCYVLHKVPYTIPTQIEDFWGNRYEIDLREWPWLPGGQFSCIKKILAKKNDERCEIIYSGADYASTKEWISKEKSNKYKHPCIHSVKANNNIYWLYSSRNDRGLFGEKKVIIAESRYIYPINDYKGEYGMTENSFGLSISSKKEGELICKALTSDKFKKIVRDTKWAGFQVDYKMFTYFKKDFWKYFV